MLYSCWLGVFLEHLGDCSREQARCSDSLCGVPGTSGTQISCMGAVGTPAHMGVFLEPFVNMFWLFLCIGAIVWLSLGCGWNILEKLCVHRCSTPLSFWCVSGTSWKIIFCTGTELRLTWGCFWNNLEGIYVHGTVHRLILECFWNILGGKCCAQVLCSHSLWMFLEYLGKIFLCTDVVVQLSSGCFWNISENIFCAPVQSSPSPLALGCFRNILEGVSLWCFWNNLERIFVCRRNTPGSLCSVLEHLGRQLVCTGVAMSATTSWKFFLLCTGAVPRRTLGCFWNFLEAMFMHKCCIFCPLCNFCVQVLQSCFLEHLGSNFGAQAQYSGSLWDVSGTSRKAVFVHRCNIPLLTL